MFDVKLRLCELVGVLNRIGTLVVVGDGRRRGSRRLVRARVVFSLRLILAAIVLAVALRMAFGLGIRPDEIYTVVPL